MLQYISARMAVEEARLCFLRASSHLPDFNFSFVGMPLDVYQGYFSRSDDVRLKAVLKAVLKAK